MHKVVNINQESRRKGGENPTSRALWWKASPLTLSQSYNMIESDCAEGSKHENRDGNRISEEFQGDV